MAYGWLNTGLLATIASDLGSGSVRATTGYGYDADGRQLTETFVRDGVQYRNATAAYDALGRMTAWQELGSGAIPAASMAWAYDAVGNIRGTVTVRTGLDPPAALNIRDRPLDKS